MGDYASEAEVEAGGWQGQVRKVAKSRLSEIQSLCFIEKNRPSLLS